MSPNARLLARSAPCVEGALLLAELPVDPHPFRRRGSRVARRDSPVIIQTLVARPQARAYRQGERARMSARTAICVVACLVLCCAAVAQPASVTYLSDLDPVSVRQDWGQPGMDRSVQGNPLRIGGREFARGIGTHANSEIVYELDEPGERFEAWVGVDAEMAGYTKSSVVFRLLVDGRERFNSGVMRLNTPPMRVDVPIAGAREIRLIVGDAGDGIDCDHADWADARLVGVAKAASLTPSPRYAVAGPGLRLWLSERGEIAGLAPGRAAERRPVSGGLRVAGLRPAGGTAVRRLPGGGISFTASLASADGSRRCTLVQRFRPARTGVRWEAEIAGEGAPWSAPVVIRMDWPNPEQATFWTPWSDPEMKTDRWRDPLTPQPFADLNLPYGVWGEGFCIPLAVVLDRSAGAGFSLAPSTDEALLGLFLSTRRNGAIRFTHTWHRIEKGRVARFAVDLAGHSPDVRAALRWMVDRYPALFEPPVKAVREMAGCGAYSGYEGPLDADKMKRMGFRMNWKASFDFPYMGLFLPPVPKETDTWERFDADSGGSVIAGKRTFTSRRQMNDYSGRMRAGGFYVLNYFNVTEFGANVQPPDKARHGLPDGEVWKRATDLLYDRLADGLLTTPDGKPYGSWGGAVAMDCGSTVYRRFLLSQAREHVEKLPESAGICIDRTDWLSYNNPRADDGVSWIDGRPARSLLMSWTDLMAELGPLMHRAGKVIFANTLLSRVELYRNVDGFYAEFGGRPGPFNTAALLGLRKPVMEWTATEADLRPNPDLFFQRHLYMGVFPTVPYPGNDHTINPSAWAERYYEDYGPLLDALRGRTWALWPHPIEADGSAKANLFQTPGGYVIPVVFGGKAASVRVTARGLKGIDDRATFEALLPGGGSVLVRADRHGDEWQLDVPLRRGCAVVRLSRASG
jgi:hypothetical protein